MVPANRSRRGRRILGLLAALGGTALAGVVVLAWLLARERNREVTLPAPTGLFSVGRVVYHWTDRQDTDAAAPAPASGRELLVWIWYPASPPADAPFDDYVPSFLRAAVAQTRGGIVGLLTRKLDRVHSHSVRDADPSLRQPSFPVVILRAGASAEMFNYSTIAEEVASYGYVVVGFDAPHRTRIVAFPDGRVFARTPDTDLELFSGAELERRAKQLLAAWTADTAFVLDRLAALNAANQSKFAHRLELTRVGVVGHSFGGAVAAQFCAQDARCKAGIDIDGSLHGSVVETGIHKPFLFLLSDHGESRSDPETRRILDDIQSVYDRLPAGERLRIVIRGANHFAFSDDGAVLKSGIVRSALRMTGVLGIDGRRQLEVTGYCVRRFFDAYLKRAPGMSPVVSPAAYREIQVH